MRVFITWSGEASKAIATALRWWIPTVIQSVDAFMSETDIEKGVHWQHEISAKLEEADLGIICLTPGSLGSRWVLFEAGALARKIQANEARVCTYLFGLSPADVEPPLSMFQHTLATKADTRRLIFDIKKFGNITGLTDEALGRLFERMWPDLETALTQVPREGAASRRDLRDMVEEALGLLRGLATVPSDMDSSTVSLREALIRAAVPSVPSRKESPFADKLKQALHPQPAGLENRSVNRST